jgi:hypothetical protein
VSVRAVINPLDARSMYAYIAHRLTRAGGDPTLFEPAALRAIVRHARGIPRRANILCHNALLFSFGRGNEQVTANAANEAIAEMEERQHGRWRRPVLQRLDDGERPGWRRWARRIGIPIAASVAVLLMAGAPTFTRSYHRTPVPGAAAQPAAVATDSVAANTKFVARAAQPVAPPATAPAAPPASAPARIVVPMPEPPPGSIRLRGGDTASPNAQAPAPAAPKAAAPPAPSASADTVTPGRPNARLVQINPGGTVLAAARTLYGNAPIDRRVAVGLLREVRRLNPEIADIDVVAAGAVVKFPTEIPGGQLAARGPE